MIPDVGAVYFSGEQPRYRVEYDRDVLWHLVDQHGNRCCCYNRNRAIAEEVAKEMNGGTNES